MPTFLTPLLLRGLLRKPWQSNKQGEILQYLYPAECCLQFANVNTKTDTAAKPLCLFLILWVNQPWERAFSTQDKPKTTAQGTAQPGAVCPYAKITLRILSKNGSPKPQKRSFFLQSAYAYATLIVVF
jgi:hypothetical protein